MFRLENHRFIELEDDSIVFSHLTPEDVKKQYKKWKNTKKLNFYNIPLSYKRIKYHKLEGKELYIQYTLDKIEKNLKLGVSVYFIMLDNGNILSECKSYNLRLDYKNKIYGLVGDLDDKYLQNQNPKFMDCFSLDLDYIMDKIFKDTTGWREFSQ